MPAPLLPGERLASGHRVGPYLIERCLGSGAFAEVYLARHTLLDQPVALKVIRTRDAEGWEQDGARIMCRLRHPNIVSVHFADHIDGRLVIAMDYVEGRTLQELLRAEGTIPVGQAVRIARAVCDALDYMHGFNGDGFAHLDLKPSNILIGIDEQVRLTDFGLARVAERTSGNRARVAGSPAYMAPEQFDGHGSKSSDIWAVGVLLHEMLTGDTPFEGSSISDYRAAIQGRGPRPWRSGAAVPERLRAVIDRCLHANPEERFASAREIIDALDRAAGGGADRACPNCGATLPDEADRCVECTVAEIPPRVAPGRWQRTRERKRPRTTARRRWWLAAAMALAVPLATYGSYEAILAYRSGTTVAREWQRIVDLERQPGGDFEDRIVALKAFIDAHPGTAEATTAAERLTAWTEDARLYLDAESYERSGNVKISEALRRWRAFLTAQRAGFRVAQARARLAHWERQLGDYRGHATLRVVAASGLPVSDTGLLGHEQTDAYFVLFRNDDPVYRSLTVRDTPAPVWNEQVRVYLEPGVRLAVEIRDRDPLRDEVVARVEIARLPPDGPFQIVADSVQVQVEIAREK